MDYNQEQFFRMQMDVPKMPFYMSYPMQNLYLTEMEYEKDMDRMKELYPRDVSRIMDVIEDECDKMEYEGSLMFDEYPDRLMLEQVTERIYRNVAGEEKTAAVKEAVEEKAAAKTETVKDTAAETKETAKPAREKKPSRAAKKAAKAAKEELKPEVFIQYQGNEAIVADVIEKAKNEFVADGHRASSIKSLQVYLKPEEFAAYYVINQKFAGRVDLF